MTTEEIRAELFRRQDLKYRDFQGALIPTVPTDRVIGVRTPALRAFAKELSRGGGADEFLADLPHRYFDENQLHAFLLCEIKDFDRCLSMVDRFLSFVDNWATSDQLSPAVFRRHRERLLPFIRRALDSGETYRVRFGIKMLMDHFLDEAFDPIYLSLVAGVTSEEYYVKMMVAWYFATAIAKRYDETVPYVERKLLPPWTHNKAIQKARESYRVSPERKDYLRSLRIKIPR
ncbi:MAG: DNA alkylation repair protein [Clostridia bacterium]|nr:DNA alkylation repair protein [Clostridia bacterium]